MKKIQKSFPALGTLNSITIWFDEEKVVEKEILTLLEEIKNEVLEKHRKWNVYDPESELSKLNAMAGIEPVKVSKDTLEMIERTKQYYDLTEGAFDITVRPLVDLWGIGKKDHFVPEKREIQRTLKMTGQNVILTDLENREIFLKKKGSCLDLGGIAKGFILDLVTKKLEEADIKEGILNFGGSVRVMGRPVKVGIQSPGAEIGKSFGSIVVKDQTLITSGYYEKFFIKENRIYHHILDPDTGYPSKSDVKAITLVGQKGELLDVLATTGIIKGIPFLLPILTELKIDAIVIFGDESVFITEGLKNTFAMNKGQVDQYE